MRRYLALWSRLPRNFVSSRVCASFAGRRDEAYRGRERAFNGNRYPLPVTVTRGTRRYINFGFAARGRSRLERRSANSGGKDGDDPRAQTKRDYHPAVRKYASYPDICTCAVHYVVSIAIFSPGRPPSLSFFFASAKWNERALQRIPTAKTERGRGRERQGKISFNLLRCSPTSFKTGSVWKLMNGLLLRLASERVSRCESHDCVILNNNFSRLTRELLLLQLYLLYKKFRYTYYLKLKKRVYHRV